jgi:hypothetical protein
VLVRQSAAEFAALWADELVSTVRTQVEVVVDAHTVASVAPSVVSWEPVSVQVCDPWLGASTPVMVAVGPPPRDGPGLDWRLHRYGESVAAAGVGADPLTEVELVGDDS